MKRAGVESQRGYRVGIALIRSTMLSMQALGIAGGPWLDLAIRFWLAKGFLIGATLRMAMHAPLTMAFASPVSPTVDWLIASPLGATIATVCPILLLVGCCSRVASLPLLFQALALHGPEGPSPLHLFWAVLLGWIIVHGPGLISIDAVLSRGLVSTAIPGSSFFGQAVAIATRIAEPWYRLALRLWIATAPLGVGTAVLPRAGGAIKMSMTPWLASYPDAAAAQPVVSLSVASLLICGLGTRLSALFLALAVPILQAPMQLDERLYSLLALGILIFYGPGPFALDRLVDRAFRRLDRDAALDDARLPHVVIVGGGFGGLAAARGLASAACRITLVDRRNYITYSSPCCIRSPPRDCLPATSPHRFALNSASASTRTCCWERSPVSIPAASAS